MRYFLILAALVFQLSLSAYAQRGEKEPEPDRGPEPETKDDPSGASNSDGQSQGEALGVPGALAIGQNPKPAPEDDEIDFDDIADALKELIEKIVDAIDDSLGGSSSSTAQAAATTSAIMQEARIPFKATPCSNALDAYTTCSTAYNGTLSAAAATVQAGCLCNVYNGFDFNANMESCYSYAQNQIQYQSYASVIANATAACTCDPNDLQVNVANGAFATFSACTVSSTTTPTAASSTSGAGSVPGVSSSTPSPTTSGAVRSFGIRVSAVMAAVVLEFMSVLH